VILTGEMAGWPALTRWTPDYLKERLGDRPVEYQGGRAANARFEMEKDVHRRQAPFAAFMDEISQPGAGNDAYITAYNSDRNAETLSLLHEDMRPLGKFLDPSAQHANGMMWIGPAGTVTSLHHDLTNNFIAQVVGRKRLKILPAAEVGKLYNSRHVFSDIPDVEAPNLDLALHPRLAGARAYEVVLEPGEIIFMPLAWWHQVKSLEFSVTVTYTNFLWPNDGHLGYPS
jgi:ribosomal protein L16 Arg81 hydroxylase